MDVRILNAVKYIGGTVLTIGTIIFLFGFFESGYSLLTPIGIGTVVGATFIFLMGVFLVATQEMLEKTHKGKKVVLMKRKKGAPF
ncbi:hypothetical protein [Bacillus sp. V5-8f]|uniref:hypothetical protein n=1 Tax=Bacillus sp. V5-8f TaxID=2053044 RepID=UPI000C75F6D6|nr:hypothetical protein [Bacillus sp. V5-8f]PLT32920.1 hypothetical protein CUU64_15895 [Bacillus sp. V5-8f]